MTDISHPDQRRLFLKAKTRALIAEFGVEAAAEITGRSSTTVSRWQHFDTPDSAPVESITVLETACGKPIVSDALAKLHGSLARERAGAGAPAGAHTCVREDCADTFSDLASSASGLSTQLAIAISDGTVTNAECQQAMRLIAETRRSMDAMEHALIKAAGVTGPKVVENGEAG